MQLLCSVYWHDRSLLGSMVNYVDGSLNDNQSIPVPSIRTVPPHLHVWSSTTTRLHKELPKHHPLDQYYPKSMFETAQPLCFTIKELSQHHLLDQYYSKFLFETAQPLCFTKNYPSTFYWTNATPTPMFETAQSLCFTRNYPAPSNRHFLSHIYVEAAQPLGFRINYPSTIYWTNTTPIHVWNSTTTRFHKELPSAIYQTFSAPHLCLKQHNQSDSQWPIPSPSIGPL